MKEKMINVLIVMFIALSITACGGNGGVKPPPDQVIKTEFVKEEVPAELTKPCEVDRPIAKEDYLKKSPLEREQYLGDYVLLLYGAIEKCNEKLRGIADRFTPAKKAQ